MYFINADNHRSWGVYANLKKKYKILSFLDALKCLGIYIYLYF